MSAFNRETSNLPKLKILKKTQITKKRGIMCGGLTTLPSILRTTVWHHMTIQMT